MACAAGDRDAVCPARLCVLKQKQAHKTNPTTVCLTPEMSPCVRVCRVNKST